MTNTPTPVVPSTFAGEQAAELLSATGTANDGAIVPLVYPALAGLPVDSGNPLPVTQTNVAKETGGNLASLLATLIAGIGVTVGNFPGTQVVSGTVTAILGAGSALLGKVGIDQTTPGTTNGVVVNNFPGTQPVSGTVTANAGTNMSTAALALESGGHLAAIDTSTGRIPAQGQALAAGSLPVVLPAAQVTTLTPPAAITGYATSAKQPALGTAGTPSADVLSVQGEASMTPLKVDGSGVTQPVSGTVTANAGSGTLAVSAASLPLPAGASTAAKQPALGTAGSAASDVLSVQGIASMTALKTDGSAVIQPVSASALPLPSGAATAAKQPAVGTAGSASVDVLSVQGVASMTALKVDGSAVTQPVSAAALPLPAGAATVAKQPALGTAGTASADVLSVQGIASMTALKTDGSGVTQPVSAASLPLPTGAALEAGHLATIDTSTARIPAQGQALAAASLPVVLTAIQQTALTPPAAITGFALEAGHLAAIDTSTAKIPAQGQALAAASLPVVLTAIQQTALTPPAAITNFANETGGNLATLAGAVSGAKVQATIATALPAGSNFLGTVNTYKGPASTATVTSVNGSATSVQLLASNGSRKQGIFYNDSTAILYLKFGTTASTTSYTVQMAAQSYFELPGPVYQGEIDGIWSSAAGAVRCTELT